MTLDDFIRKYNLTIKEVCDVCKINPARLYVLRNGGCHRAMKRIAPLVEGMVENCKDKIYIPPKGESSKYYVKTEKLPFNEEERKLVAEKPYLLPHRTREKVFNGHLFSKKVHDDILAAVKGENNRYKGSDFNYQMGG